MSEWIKVEDRSPDKAEKLFYWVVPKKPEDCPHNSSGKPITAYGEKGYRIECKWGGWSCLYMPTHYMQPPEPPTQE